MASLLMSQCSKAQIDAYHTQWCLPEAERRHRMAYAWSRMRAKAIAKGFYSWRESHATAGAKTAATKKARAGQRHAVRWWRERGIELYFSTWCRWAEKAAEKRTAAKVPSYNPPCVPAKPIANPCLATNCNYVHPRPVPNSTSPPSPPSHLQTAWQSSLSSRPPGHLPPDLSLKGPRDPLQMHRLWG